MTEERLQRTERGVSRAEWFAFAAALLLFFLIRLPLFFEPAVRLGWHSDAAAFGLMGRDMYEGRFHLFWWGQSYMGTLTSAFAALGGVILAPFGVTPPVGPLALRLGTAVEWSLMMFFYWFGMRAAFGPAVAAVTALLLATGPGWFFHSQLAPRGAEMLLLISGAIFALAVRGLERRRAWFVFGLLYGLGWWMHQGVVFAIGGVLLVLFLRSRLWEIARPSSLSASLLMRGRPTGLQIVNAVLLLLVAAGIVRDFIPRFPALFLHEPVFEPLVVWAAFRLVCAAFMSRRMREALAHLSSQRGVWMPRSALFIAGAVLAYLPVIVGSVLGAYENTYGFSAPFQTPSGVVSHFVRALRSDFWTLIDAQPTPIGIATTAALLVLLAGSAIRHRRAIGDLFMARPGAYGPRAMAGVTVILCLAFYLLSRRAYEGAVRYIAPAVPFLFAFAVAEGAALWAARKRAMRVAAAAAVLVLTLGYAVQRMQLVDEIVAKRAEGRFFTGGGFSSGPVFDPFPTMAAIDRGGYRICYAHYATAFKLEWLLDRRVQFISYNSVEPRRALARELATRPVPKCFVDGEGNVRPWDPAEHDDSIGRAAAERLRRMR